MRCSDGARRDSHGCHQTLEEASSRAHALVDLWEDGEKLFQTNCKEWRERVSEIEDLHQGQQNDSRRTDCAIKSTAKRQWV